MLEGVPSLYLVAAIPRSEPMAGARLMQPEQIDPRDVNRLLDGSGHTRPAG
ncbi:hypothetical protein ACCAA_670083 [Candidatus Accumulibacter aalborgensis]|uniref:Uncharacterized protein n=1 Tax=Candidatus Accumulibacter aalborgensis TaxID=1860102 RepID=A0A1A8XVY6_9PROT|nr:hypothetical protein ACCAA_670083 [Candidatus Accumulibacter aalborgensis]